jgi:hypothetical protein
MLPIVRLIVAVVAALVAIGGLAAVSVGEPAGLWAIAVGGGGIIAVAMERTRYRSRTAERTLDAPGPGGGDPAAPAPPFRPTDERFVDPTSGRTMRVYVNPATGERRYHADA